MMKHNTTTDNAGSGAPAFPFVERLVPLAEICVRTTLDRATIRRLAAARKFPALKRRGDRRVFVLESELLAWMRGDDGES